MQAYQVNKLTISPKYSVVRGYPNDKKSFDYIHFNNHVSEFAYYSPFPLVNKSEKVLHCNVLNNSEMRCSSKSCPQFNYLPSKSANWHTMS